MMNFDTHLINNKYYPSSNYTRSRSSTNSKGEYVSPSASKRSMLHSSLPPLKAIYLKPGRKCLNTLVTNVLHTNGLDELKEDKSEKRGKISHYVPWLGVDKSKLEISDNITIDIDSESTRMPIFCHLLHINEGGVLKKKVMKRLMRDVGIQIGPTQLPLSTYKSYYPNISLISSDNEYYSNFYYYKNWLVNRDLKRKLEKSVQAIENDTINYASTQKQQQQQKQQEQNQPKTKESFTLNVPITVQNNNSTNNLTASITSSTTTTIPNQQSIIVKNSSISTEIDEDFVNYLKQNHYPVTQLDLPHSIDFIYSKTRSESLNRTNNVGSIKAIEPSKSCYKIRYRKANGNSNTDTNSNYMYMKKFDCPLTGSIRSSLLAPYEHGYSKNFFNDSKKESSIEKYEEYYVIDSTTDTNDIEKYVDMERYTCLQLFSNRAILEYVITPKVQITEGRIFYLRKNMFFKKICFYIVKFLF